MQLRQTVTDEFSLRPSFVKPGEIAGVNDKHVNGMFIDVHSTIEMLIESYGRDLEVEAAPLVQRMIVQMYGFGIPTRAAIDKIVEASPQGIIEVGAGTGYWAYLLRERGVDVDAIDSAPVTGNKYVLDDAPRWTHVRPGSVPDVDAANPRRALFLCWPPYRDATAADALRAYRGETLIYVGEGRGGCTATNAFFKLLDRDWERVGGAPVVQWHGLHDRLTVYRRRPEGRPSLGGAPASA
jgi:hypothetical protein